MNMSQLLMHSQQANNETWHTSSWLGKASNCLSRGDLARAEQLLLNHLGQTPLDADERADGLWLLGQLYSQQLLARDFKQLVRQISIDLDPSDHRLHQLSLQCERLLGRGLAGPYAATLQELSNGSFPHLDLEIGGALLRQGQVEAASIALERSGARSSCEALLLQAKILEAQHKHTAAETLLLSHWPSHQHRLDYGLQLVELLFTLRRGETCLPVLKQAAAQQGCYASPLLERFAQGRMLQRQPAIALRLKLQERLYGISGAMMSPATTLGTIYDSLGRSDWLEYLNNRIQKDPFTDPELHSQRLMHLSSRCSAQYPQSCTAVVGLIEKYFQPQLGSLHRTMQPNSPRRLRVGWICADIANHPVARFLLSWLAAAAGNLQHQHLVIGTVAADPRYKALFQQLPKVQFIDQSTLGTPAERIERLRKLQLDLAIDLNGWTGNHLAAAFITRVAPLQLNYLAYHASTGIPAMDVWVVDQHVVPAEDVCEWHTEQLLRLPRHFLAWQPHPSLPEARAQVSPICFEASSGIRLGCFNHLRKISDQALQCWARILTALPTARLVLKANSSEDKATASLLQRRLERSGLPLEQVIWLPFTATPDEHLQHYSQMDVALDSFPNTGCTTTCEALWMGVPVISLEGSHYVSRMAAAMLHGAELPEWICQSTSAYEQLAIQQAKPDRLAWLRRNRPRWRQQLQQSPLGDARDLIRQLESSFTALAEQRLAEQTLELAAHAPGLVQG